MKIKNATPHPITLCGQEIVPSGFMPRIEAQEVGSLNTKYGEVPVFTTATGRVLGEPPMRPGVVWVVSRMVFDASEREDYACLAKFLRDGRSERVLGAGGLVMHKRPREERVG